MLTNNCYIKFGNKNAVYRRLHNNALALIKNLLDVR